MKKANSPIVSETPIVLNDDPVVVEVRPLVYCTRGDLIGTPAPPDGKPITRTTEADDAFIVEAAKAVTAAMKKHPDPTGKWAIMAAKWANIVGAVDLMALGEPAGATVLALSVLQPPKDDERAA